MHRREAARLHRSAAAAAPVVGPEDVVGDLLQPLSLAVADQHALHPQPQPIAGGIQLRRHCRGAAGFAGACSPTRTRWRLNSPTNSLASMWPETQPWRASCTASASSISGTCGCKLGSVCVTCGAVIAPASVDRCSLPAPSTSGVSMPPLRAHIRAGSERRSLKDWVLPVRFCRPLSADTETCRSGFAGPVGRSDQIPVLRPQLVDER